MNELVRDEGSSNLWNMWFTELHQERVGLAIKVSRVLHSAVSDFQRIDVLETEEFGRALVLYGSIMITEKDEFVYHEMISHVPLHVHPDPARVLIVGGGDGGTLREVLKHEQVKKAQMVEIDPEVVAVSKRFFPEVGTGFDDPRAQVIHQDAAVYMAETQQKYDVVLSDTSDPIGPAEVLFQQPFYESVYHALDENGIFVAQTESPWLHRDNITKIYKNLRAVFPIVAMYTAMIPTYPGFLWSFAFCAKRLDPLKDFQPTRVTIPGLRYYNPAVHQGAFALPNFVQALL